MPRKARELSATEIRRLTHAVSADGKPYNALHPVGGVAGLILQVTPSGARSWIYRTVVGVKRRNIGLGGFPDLPLADARSKARELKAQIEQGIDPIEQRQSARRALITSQLAAKTFESAAREYIAEKVFRNPRTQVLWLRSLEIHAFPHIGNMPVNEIELVHIRQVLDLIWKQKPETAENVQKRIENILGWCAIHGYRKSANPAKWKGYLDKIYTTQPRRDKGHFSALPIDDMPDFMKRLKSQPGTAARALEFLILTASRTNETVGDKRIKKLGVTWKEIDLKAKVWTIPAQRMKAEKEHRIPLNDAAVKLLESMEQGGPDDQVFSGRNGAIPSNNFLSAVLKRMDVAVTVHGFRSTFKDWARERTAYDDEVSELALAHVNSDATRAAYRRADMLDKRRNLMKDWEQFCYHGKTVKGLDNVTSIGGRGRD